MTRRVPNLILILLLPLLLGSYGTPVIMHPADFRSASGEYRWHVDPADRDAGAGARYTLYRGNVRVLARTHAFALRDAAVADDGTLGGYAHRAAGGPRESGRFVVALVRPDGAAQVLVDELRRPSPYLHVDDDPRARGVLVDSFAGILTIRVGDPDLNRGLESWQRYRLADGTALAPIAPTTQQSDNARLHHILYAQPIEGTGLTLIQWHVRDDQREAAGTRVAVIDSGLQAVWSLDLRDEFAALSKARDKPLRERIGDHGSVLENRTAGFSLWQAATRERVDYRLTHGEDGAWKIEEAGRGKHDGPAATPAPADLPTPPSRALEFLGHVKLAVGSSGGPALGDFNDFGIDDQGRFGLLRCGCDVVGSFLLVDGQGATVREIALDFVPVAQSSTARIAWIAGKRWLLTFDDGKRSQAFFIDMATGRAQQVTGFDAPPVEALSADGSGGFVVLTQLFADSTVESSLRAFDDAGRLRWRVEEGHGDDSRIFSAEDVAVTSDGIVVVLENVSDALKRFDRNGRPLGAVKLAELWGREPNYLSGIEADASGGVIVVDFHGKPAVVRMRAGGDVLGELTPALADGQRFEMRGNVQKGPDGELWTSDGSALYRLDASGHVAQMIGAAPDADLLAEIAALLVTPAGGIYATDARTGAVHVFAADGSRTRICRPARNDYDEKLSLPSLAVTDDGAVYVARDDEGQPDFLHYASDCRRLGIESLALDPISQEWLAQAGSSNRWVVGYEEIYRVDAAGKLLATITRTARGRWLDHPDGGASAPDGSLAVITEHAFSVAAATRRQRALALYGPAGEPLRDLPAPRGLVNWVPLAFDGERLALIVASDSEGKQRSAWVMDALSGDSYRVANPRGMPEQAFLVHPGRAPELWLSDGKGGIDRFAL